MEMDDKGIFEKQWAEAMEGAEVAPSAAVWDNIDLALANSQTLVYQKRYGVMRGVAAAAVILLLFFAGFSYYQWKEATGYRESLALTQMQTESSETVPTESEMASLSEEERNSVNEINSESNSLDSKEDSQSIEGQNESTQIRDTKSADTKQTGTTGPSRTNSAILTSVANSKPNEQKSNFLPIGEEENVYTGLDRGNSLGLTEVAFAEMEMNGIRGWEFNFVEEKEKKKGFWAGLDMSGGTFVPQGPELSLASADFALAEADNSNGFATFNQSDISGSTRGYGIGVGTYLNDKITLQGGLQYASVQAGRYSGSTPYLANNVAASRASFYANNTSGLFQVETFHFISMPIRAGYYLLDKKLSISVNPGVDSRFYVNKSVQRYVNGPSTYDLADVDLNPVTFWGELSSDITYQVGEHYRLGITPSYKLALNPLEKGSGVHPSLAEVAFSMRYLFK